MGGHPAVPCILASIAVPLALILRSENRRNRKLRSLNAGAAFELEGKCNLHEVVFHT
jgi:hypothetical protein